jgi:hypothetical protein
MLFQDFRKLLSLALFYQLHELRKLPHKVLVHRHEFTGAFQTMFDHLSILKNLYVVGESGLRETVIESPTWFLIFFKKLSHGIHSHGIPESFHHLI